jgi:inosine/xanthosine triphosphate pyrophosphatase family protein
MEEKNLISHRARALSAMVPQILKALGLGPSET